MILWVEVEMPSWMLLFLIRQVIVLMLAGMGQTF